MQELALRHDTGEAKHAIHHQPVFIQDVDSFFMFLVLFVSFTVALTEFFSQCFEWRTRRPADGGEQVDLLSIGVIHRLVSDG